MKRLYRSRKERIFAGICGGIGEYLNVDPVLVRIVFVLAMFAGGLSLLVYIVAYFLIPLEPYENFNKTER